MNHGIKVEGGDKIGKTIIFAKNKRHAEFIIDRFNILYPKYKGQLAKPVYTGIKYVESTMSDFEVKEKLPQIAVSVDMLDTGIDIPEVVNLVFFKKIRSKTKFWQMVGRGTRLCLDLFGVGLHKEGFRIFDYCGNFEFFRANKNGKEVKISKTLTEKLFNVKLNIVKELQHLNYQNDYYISYSNELITGLSQAIKVIDESKFYARLKIEYIHKYNKKESLYTLQDSQVKELEDHVAPLVPPIQGDEMAKRFDYLMYTIEYADLKGLNYSMPKQKVIITAENLAKKGRVEQIQAHAELIKAVQTEEFWQNATVKEYEQVREAFRDLIKTIEKEKKNIYYTNFQDEIIEIKDGEAIYTVNEMQSYRKKVNQYLKQHSEDLAVYKLRNNKELQQKDLKHLETLLWQELGTKEDYQREYGDEPLLKMVSRIVGLEPQTANEIFSEFLTDENLNVKQMEFVKLIVNYIIKNGSIEKEIINEHPFNKRGNIVNLFTGKLDVAREIIKVVDKLNERLIV
ncbi:type I restriction-modification enzyme R subunit C-terminal domain-containing protein [Clostridium sp. 'deep sea']|uniref:type I restriction-modification enzyme R subunit C-terminal domain-containing protein n=1 Tax=Clostridium sp. 'deep sea' TaxID=2779445 RepID=UPI001FAC71DB